MKSLSCRPLRLSDWARSGSNDIEPASCHSRRGRGSHTTRPGKRTGGRSCRISHGQLSMQSSRSFLPGHVAEVFTYIREFRPWVSSALKVAVSELGCRSRFGLGAVGSKSCPQLEILQSQGQDDRHSPVLTGSGDKSPQEPSRNGVLDTASALTSGELSSDLAHATYFAHSASSLGVIAESLYKRRPIIYVALLTSKLSSASFALIPSSRLSPQASTRHKQRPACMTF